MEEVESLHWDTKPHSRSNRTPGSHTPSMWRQEKKQCLLFFCSPWLSKFTFPHFSGSLNPFLAMHDSGNPPKLWGVTGNHPAKVLRDRITGVVVPLMPYHPQYWRSPHECWKRMESMQGSMLHLGKCIIKSSDLRRWTILSGFLIFTARQSKLVLEGQKQEENQAWRSFNWKTRTKWTFETEETKWR